MIRPLAEVEKEAILMAIMECEYDVVEAAERLGMGKTTIYRKLQEWRLTRKAGVGPWRGRIQLALQDISQRPGVGA